MNKEANPGCEIHLKMRVVLLYEWRRILSDSVFKKLIHGVRKPIPSLGEKFKPRQVVDKGISRNGFALRWRGGDIVTQ